MRILNIRHVIQRSDTSHKEFVPSYTSILFIRRDGVTRFDIMVNLSFFIFFIEGVADISQILLQDTHVLPTLDSYEENCRRDRG
jgi:hypothetical protein